MVYLKYLYRLDLVLSENTFRNFLANNNKYIDSFNK